MGGGNFRVHKCVLLGKFIQTSLGECSNFGGGDANGLTTMNY